MSGMWKLEGSMVLFLTRVLSLFIRNIVKDTWPIYATLFRSRVSVVSSARPLAPAHSPVILIRDPAATGSREVITPYTIRTRRRRRRRRRRRLLPRHPRAHLPRRVAARVPLGTHRAPPASRAASPG